ncbi:YiiD C-terminal domain-containing protein [Cobetia marina]|uniref:YiiD C-terminal domain-containing protein n=1 Tax=Cobetia marina TaxID=28258 RepID=UPI001748EEC0
MNEQLRSSGEAWPPLPLPRDGQGRSGTLAAPVGEDLSRFRDWLSQAIPLAAHMGLVEMQWSEPERSTGQLSWRLHLPPNLNDKGTAFGGAMSLEATLCGWSWVTLWLRARGIQRDLVVSRASQQFLAPVSGDYHIRCAPDDMAALIDVGERLAAGRRARLSLTQQLWCQVDGQSSPRLCFEARGDFVVLGP